MPDYINREAAKALALKYSLYFLENKIDGIPAADVAPVVHGRWLWYSTAMQECSVCKKHTPRHRYNYCPNCGAKMDGGEDNA